MKIELEKEFFYRINVEKSNDLYQKFNTGKNNVLRNNDNLDFYNGEWVKIKTNDYITHIVKPAETINSICETYNLEKQKLIDDNNLKSEHLFIGQMLKVIK